MAIVCNQARKTDLSHPPRSTLSDAGCGLPQKIVQLTRTPQGIKLYFPPLRSVAASVGLALFGVICAALPTVAGAALVSALSLDTYGLLVIVLLAGFALPFFAFGLAFIAIAAYQIANSLVVWAEPAGITTERRILGFTLSRRFISSADLAAVVSQIPSRFQSPLSSEPTYRLIAWYRAPGEAGMVVAESLSGEPLMVRVKTLIEDAATARHRSETA